MIATAREHLKEIPDDQEARLHMALLLGRLGLVDQARAEVDLAEGILIALAGSGNSGGVLRTNHLAVANGGHFVHSAGTNQRVNVQWRNLQIQRRKP